MKRVLAATIAGVIVGATGAYAVLHRDLANSGTQGPHVVRDIREVPAMSDADATLHRANRYDSLHSIAQILALPTVFAQTEALYVLAGRSDSGAVQNLVYEGNRVADADNRDRALTILFSRLTELDPRSALAMARTASFSGDSDIEAGVWRGWGKLDLENALLAAASQSTPGQRNLAAQALFSAYGYLGNDTTARIEHELGIRPDRTSRARYLYELADRSPADAIEYVSNISSSRDQWQSVSWLAHHLSRSDAVRAAGYADLFTDATLRETYRNIVASSASSAEPELVLDRLLTVAKTREEEMQVYGAMRELAARDIDAAIQYFEQAGSLQDRQRIASLIAEELARQDPARALGWARDNERGDYPQLMMQVLHQIAQSDPRLAMEEARNIPHAERRRQVMSNLTRTVARNNPALAAEMVDQIASGFERESAAVGVVMGWAREDPEAAINWVMNNDVIDRKSVLDRLAGRLAMRDSDTAMRLLPLLDEKYAAGWRLQLVQNLAAQGSAAEAQRLIDQLESGEDYGKLQAALISGIAKNDVYRAKQLAEQLPVGADRDKAYVQLVTQHVNVNPAEAAAWLGSIADERQRSFATQQLVRNWYMQDPDAAGRWADNLPRGTQRDDAIVGLVSNWKELTPSRRLLIDSIGSAEKQTRARTEHIRIVARTDWQKAQTMLADTEMPAAERQRLQELIDHYRNR